MAVSWGRTSSCWPPLWLALLALLLAGLGLGDAWPVLGLSGAHPSASGADYYQFVAGSRGSNPYFYPPAPLHGHAFHGHGQVLNGVDQDGRAPFLSGWDRERDLYSSRYAASALPVAFPVHYEPSQRLFGTRGRPAMVPTPYLKYSSHAASGSLEKGKYVGGSPHRNSLVAFPEPGFYGRSGPSGQESVMPYGQGHGYADTPTGAIGFYGKPT